MLYETYFCVDKYRHHKIKLRMPLSDLIINSLHFETQRIPRAIYGSEAEEFFTTVKLWIVVFGLLRRAVQ
jgi:hypothetical protein